MDFFSGNVKVLLWFISPYYAYGYLKRELTVFSSLFEVLFTVFSFFRLLLKS